MERPAERQAGTRAAPKLTRGRAWGIIAAAVVALAIVGLLLGSPQGWLVIAGMVIAPFTIRLADRPPMFAGFIAAAVASGLWWRERPRSSVRSP